MRAFIYTGGEINAANITERPEEKDLVIAADSGWNNAKTLGAKPSILLGDFDSLGHENLPDGPEIYQVPAEKDLTDTQLAVEMALSRGATEIVIIGGLSGRLDHTLSNLAILEHLYEKKIHAMIADGQNRARFVRNSGALIPRGGYKYLSLLAADEVVKGVCVKGCKYPLEKAKLKRTYQFAVSNEIEGNCALVEVKKGGLYIIESCDK